MHIFFGRHFVNMLGYFFAATALSLWLGISISTSGLVSGAFAATLISLTGLAFGLASTMKLRGYFGLMQTGRLIQYACFMLGIWLGIQLAGFLVSDLQVTSSLLGSLIIFVLAFGTATLSGEVPWKGRTWLPRRMGKGGPGSST